MPGLIDKVSQTADLAVCLVRLPAFGTAVMQGHADLADRMVASIAADATAQKAPGAEAQGRYPSNTGTSTVVYTTSQP